MSQLYCRFGIQSETLSTVSLNCNGVANGYAPGLPKNALVAYESVCETVIIQKMLSSGMSQLLDDSDNNVRYSDSSHFKFFGASRSLYGNTNQTDSKNTILVS